MLMGEEKLPEGIAETFDRWRIRSVRRRRNKRSGAGSEVEEWAEAVLDARLEATIAAHGFEVVIIDPWRVYFAGSENSNDETETALDKLRDLAMRWGVAIVILHHLGKSMEARVPEDLWRGASRLADWASTRATLLPHYTERQARDQGMTRQQSRRYVDVHFLRRAEPIDDFSIALDAATGWWDRWIAPEGGAGARRIDLAPAEVVEACRGAGCSWDSIRQAAEALGVSHDVARRTCEAAERTGDLERFPGPRNAVGYRLREASS
jgi:hypothetical protein